jgi:hypothetical protein
LSEARETEHHLCNPNAQAARFASDNLFHRLFHRACLLEQDINLFIESLSGCRKMKQIVRNFILTLYHSCPYAWKRAFSFCEHQTKENIIMQGIELYADLLMALSTWAHLEVEGLEAAELAWQPDAATRYWPSPHPKMIPKRARWAIT